MVRRQPQRDYSVRVLAATSSVAGGELFKVISHDLQRGGAYVLHGQQAALIERFGNEADLHLDSIAFREFLGD